MYKYRVFTDEEIEFAKSIDMMSYLSSKGYTLKSNGTNRYLIEPHSSLVLFTNTNSWYYFKENKGGNLINFLQYYEDKTFQEAMFEIVGEVNNREQIEQRKYTKYVPVVEKKGEIILPNSNKDNKRAYSYLTKTRGIDTEIVNELIKQGNIYQNDKGAVVFVSKDKENNVKFACVRSTSENSSFRQDVKNSAKEYGFKTVGKSNKLFVFEAPIDLLSHATISKMQGKDWKNDNRISLGGTSDKALNKFLEENNHIKEIVFFLDNDSAGIENSKKMAKKYGNDYKVEIFHSTKGKDLNEMLLNYKDEKEINNDLNLKDFIEKIKNPFITPKLKENSDISNEFIKYIDKSDKNTLSVFNYLKNNEILAENIDNKAILFINNEKGHNIGGFEFDLHNKDFNLKLLTGGEQKYMFYNDKISKSTKESICITDNPLLYANLESLFDIVLVEDLKDIEAIKSINKDLIKEYKEIGIIAGNEEKCNFFKNENLINDLKNHFNVDRIWQDDFNCCYEHYIKLYNEKNKQVEINIKDDTLNKEANLKDKIKEKQNIIDKNKQEKTNIQKNEMRR